MAEIPDDLHSLKVTELKELSVVFSLPKSGNKKDLILRLQVWRIRTTVFLDANHEYSVELKSLFQELKASLEMRRAAEGYFHDFVS